jgi:hypothetical protein
MEGERGNSENFSARGLSQLRHRVVTLGYMAAGPVRQRYAGVDFILQSGIYEFGYWSEHHNFSGDGYSEYVTDAVPKQDF